MLSHSYDVVVAGGGVAALCAAIAARRHGASVLLAEQAPNPLRGGNARHSRNFRIMHEAPTALIPDRYPADEFQHDLEHVTGGMTDGALARLLIAESTGIVAWLADNGVAFQSPAGGILPYSRKTAFFLGGGKALMNALYATAQNLGVDIRYDSEARALDWTGERVRAVTLHRAGGEQRVCARAVVVASGGFQANAEWLREHWGDAADGFVVRGTPYASGALLRALLDHGALPVGDPAYAHLVAVDGRSPKFDGGIVTRLDCVPYGIVVDRQGRRFADEGESVGPTRYALWGERVARCPGQIAFSIIDAAAENAFAPSILPPIRADSIGELAAALDLDPATLEATVRAFNAAVVPGAADPADGRTDGLAPPKTRRARPIATPPFGAYPLRAGITSTYLGVRVDERARVVTGDGAVENLFAAGVIMVPNILGRGYLSGVAMTIGAVFGRIAGREAAAHALA